MTAPPRQRSSQTTGPLGAVALLLLPALLALAGPACSSGETLQTPPAIDSFLATPGSLLPGRTTTLSWSVRGAARVVIDQGIDDVTSQTTVDVTPVGTTTYTLTARAANGLVSTQQLTVTVTPAPNQPAIDAFTASPVQIAPGGNATLAWTVRNAPQVTIDDGPSLSGTTSQVVHPVVTTVYTLRAVGAADTVPVTRTAVVTVAGTQPQDPAITSFSASQLTVAPGRAFTLTWNVARATQLSLQPGPGDVSEQTQIIVWPLETTTYTLTAIGPAGVARAARSSVAVVVSDSQTGNQPTIGFFTAFPAAILAGESATLNWSSARATQLSIDHGVGTVTGQTSALVSPIVTTIYTLTALGAAGTTAAQLSTTVTVTPQAGPRIDYAPPAQTAGASFVLTKDVANSTPTHLVLTLWTGAAAIPKAFGVALTLPADHRLATLSTSTGIALPPGPPLDPGTGAGATAAAKQMTSGPLADFLTLGVARQKAGPQDGDVALPARTPLFSFALDLAPGAAAGTVFDGANLPVKARAVALRADRSRIADQGAGIAIGTVYTSR